MEKQGYMFLFLLLAYELTGLSRGGQQVNVCATTFNKALKLLVELAGLQVLIICYYIFIFIFCSILTLSELFQVFL